jgi:hypothetical protein
VPILISLPKKRSKTPCHKHIYPLPTPFPMPNRKPLFFFYTCYTFTRAVVPPAYITLT